MGGNLFKLSRISKERYFQIIEILKPHLDNIFEDNYRIPQAYKNKTDYGDVDIIVSAGFVQNKNWKDQLIEEFELKEFKTTGAVFSTVFENIQVDYFVVSTSIFDSAYNFMCYNVIGNLLGRIFHKMGMKYGEGGLTYVFRSFSDHISKEIVVSRDMKKILEFLELDYEKWERGFDELEEIFEYIISCKYFTYKSYDLNYWNIKKRAVERKDFNAFIDYLEENSITKDYPFTKDKSEYLEKINDYFPEANLIEEWNKHTIKQDMLRNVHDKFNGKIIMKYVPLEGKPLGGFIKDFKEQNSFEDQKEYDFNLWILDQTEEEIKKEIEKFYHNNLEKYEPKER